MSLQNVELVRSALEAFAAASYDPRHARGFFEYFDPNVEYDISRTNPETQLYYGRDGIIAALAVDRDLGQLRGGGALVDRRGRRSCRVGHPRAGSARGQRCLGRA